MSKTYTDLNPSPRLLLGPGPSMVHPRVLRSMATPLVGHLDPDFLDILSDVKDLLRFVFQTENELTLAVPGTGTAAMEAALSNLIEPGDRLLACIHGYFGERLAEMADRYGAQTKRLQRPWGEVFDPDEIDLALSTFPAKIVTQSTLRPRPVLYSPKLMPLLKFPSIWRAAGAGLRHLLRRTAGRDRLLGCGCRL